MITGMLMNWLKVSKIYSADKINCNIETEKKVQYTVKAYYLLSVAVLF